MPGVVADVLVAVLAAMLIVAMAGDLRTRLIPNRLNAAIALLAIPFWFLSGLPVWPDIALQIAVAAGVFMVFLLAFQLGMMGGGDVKLVTAVALWLPYTAVVKLLLIMSIAGGVLTVVMMARQRLARSEQKPEVPYGVAIAFGGIWVIGERFLYQFG
jgi:prepilin peptidase CpaA